MKKLFTLVVLMCLLGVNRIWAAADIQFSHGSVILNSGVTSFDFLSEYVGNGNSVSSLQYQFVEHYENHFADVQKSQYKKADVGDVIRVNVSGGGNGQFVSFKEWKSYTDISGLAITEGPGYVEAVIETQDALNKLNSMDGVSIQYNVYSIQSIELRTYSKANSYTWKAEAMGDVSITSGFTSQNGNVYTLSPSNPVISFTGGALS